MYQATNPTLLFTTPYTQDQVEKLRVTLTQNNEAINFSESDVTWDGNTVSMELTQEQTAKLRTRPTLAIQMRVKLSSGKVLSSQIIYTTVSETFNLEVL